MNKLNYIEEVLLIIAYFGFMAHSRYTNLALGDIFVYDRFKEVIVTLAPLILLGLAFTIFIEKRRLLFFKKKDSIMLTDQLNQK